MEKPRIAIIGHFGGNEKFNDGQTVKTLMVHDALKRAGFEDIDRIDTYYIRKKPFRFFRMLFAGLKRNQKVIVLLSSKGRRVLFPILYRSAKMGHKEIYHYAIGGRLAKEVAKKPRWKKYVSAFKGNWMESRSLAEKLQELGVKNAIYLPNFKKLTVLTEQELRYAHSEPYRFCFFSRVMAEKGVEDAIEAIGKINAKAGRQVASLDIYGPVEPAYLERLNGLLKGRDDCRYRGVARADRSVEKLKGYYALLFPTHWKHEGIPGTIIDALSAGIPVIARRWQYCDEMIEDGKTGLVYDFDKPEQLETKIQFAINHEDAIARMKKPCLEKAKEYSEETVIKQILHEMEVE